MSDFKWNEGIIARVIAQRTLEKKCLVLVDRCNWTGHECDVLGVTMDLRVIDVEVKISRADFKADAKKDKWWHRHFWHFGDPEPPKIARPWPPKVWKHYYALPESIWVDSLLEFMPSKASGLLLLQERGGAFSVKCARRATPNRDAERLTAAQAVDVARLANLRMWDAYARAEKAQQLAVAT